MCIRDSNHTEGLLSINADDKGSYMYGEKEYWVLHSVESKTQIAEFYYNPEQRRDAHGVQGKDGLRDDNQNMEQLERIELYSRPERINSTEPIPLKVVHFEYDYSLCQNNPANDNITNDLGRSILSNSGGKLTLKKLWFTYGKSIKGKFSPYKFEYSDFNPDYNVKGYNRWSSFGRINVANNSDQLNGCGPSDDLSIIDFPYIPQYSQDNPTAKDRIDNFVSAWNLTNIKLPSGAKINVDYEADDYAYVQNKRAMQMMEIVGTSISSKRVTDVNGDFLEFDVIGPKEYADQINQPIDLSLIHISEPTRPY